MIFRNPAKRNKTIILILIGVYFQHTLQKVWSRANTIGIGKGSEAVEKKQHSASEVWSTKPRVHGDGYLYDVGVHIWLQYNYVRTSKNPRVSSDLVLSAISEIVRDKLLTWLCEVVTILKRDYGLDVSYHMVWLGMEKTKAVIHGAHSLSFDQLRWYSDAVMRYNSGSYVNIDYDANEIFLKGKYKGQLLATMAKDGNNEAMPKVFPSAYHGYCLQHLKNNLRDQIKVIDNGSRDHLVSSLGDYAYEPTVVGFHEKLEKLKEEGSKKFNLILYNVCDVVQGHALWGDDIPKLFNNWIKEVHNLPITQMVDTIRTQLMQQMSARRDQANKWNELICPTFETMLLDSFNDSRSWQVSKANEDVFEVHSIPSVTVDIARRMCSCFKWQINGFPCNHAVVAIQKSRYNLNDCVEHFFHVEMYRVAYSGAIFPILWVEKPLFDPTNFTICPPTVKRPPDRPQKNRIPSRGEKLKQIRCGRCDKLGNHNQKSCKEPI
ncbi:uncharacterized protein LOC114272126 [Camellia sinensis]|uniref:uncharacterized protein LOC114272126 n=1 Tax=Camellia sinensis TaxID=4442 RepID=UPI001035A926|nr:uncharacterized protein LOC114272126 [Camellia sinensis]